MMTRTLRTSALGALAACLFAVPAWAKVFPVETTITEVNGTGLTVTVDDVFGGQVTFDPADLPTNGVLPLDEAGRGLLLDFMSFSLTDGDDTNGAGFPFLAVSGGQITGLAMNAPAAGAFGFAGTLDFVGVGFTDQVFFTDSSGATVVAASIEVVPVPAALPLLGTAVGVLAWLRHRRARRT